MAFIAVAYNGQANGIQTNFNTEKAYLPSLIDQLQNEKTSLEGQLSSLNAQVASLNNQASTLNAQVSTLTTENAKLTAQVTDLTVQNETANARIKRLQSIIERPPNSASCNPLSLPIPPTIETFPRRPPLFFVST